MCDQNTETINVGQYSNVFIKLLVLSKSDDDFTLLYGFSVPTEQPTYQWRFRNTENKQQNIWSAILSQEEADSFVHSLTTSVQITLGHKKVKSPELLARPTVLSYDGRDKSTGPVSEFCKVTEYWNVDKNKLYEKIKDTFKSTGKELYQYIQSLLMWAHKECGIDFLKDTMRIGNFEVYHLLPIENVFDITIHKDLDLKKTTIQKKVSFSQDLIINCVAEHHGRSVSNQTKLFKAIDKYVDFIADEPMSRVTIQIWEVESCDLIFSKDITLMMGMSIDMNIGSPTYKIHDPWCDKLFASAANRSEIIKKHIETVSKSSYMQTISVKSNIYDDIDKAIEDAEELFSGYQKQRTHGAFVANIQKDGEINSFLKIREYIELPSVKRAIIADPYFSVVSAQKLLTRIQHADIQLDIITSLTDTDPDTNRKTNICEMYRNFLTNNESILHKNLSIRNLTRGKEPVFHDRYLIRFFDNGKIDGFLLSNSLNSMGQFYPFVIAPLEQLVCYEVCDYLNDLCDPAIQSKRPTKECINSELLCDFRNEHKSKSLVEPEHLPIDLWLASWCSNGTYPDIPINELESAVNTLCTHWVEDKTLTCKVLSNIASTTHPWSAKDLAATVKNISLAETNFSEEFIKLAKLKEQQQVHISKGINSRVYMQTALLNGQADPSRQGFSKIFDEAGHIFYPGDNWLKGGYTLLIYLNPSTFIELLDEIKSPLMLDVLSTQMLLYSWNEMLFYTAVNSNILCVKLLCGEYIFHQLQRNKLTTAQIEEIIGKLSKEDSSLLLAYILSQLVFHVRVTHSIKLSGNEINSIYSWMLKKLAIDVSQCNEEIQTLALYWLHDCEVYSNCKLHMDLAGMECALEIKTKLYTEVITAIEIDLTKTSYSRDVSKHIILYLQAMDYIYGEKAENKLLGKIIDWRVFETATEPVLKHYDYSRWSSAKIRSQWQMDILNQYVLQHPSSKKAKDWLEYWEPRIKAIN